MGGEGELEGGGGRATLLECASIVKCKMLICQFCA